ncbi:ATP-binding protein [Streptomyces sp. NPDC002795]|uniref:ATP-binding protein n=1 Tax=Streptomyces sp. NPDC002795 TaxID=3364665 RepID=UPI00367C2A66
MDHVTDRPDTGLGARHGFGLTVGEHSARPLRCILRAHLAAWVLPKLVDDACLALTELIANVVRHVPRRRCTGQMLRTEDGIRVEVSDDHPKPRPHPPRPINWRKAGTG